MAILRRGLLVIVGWISLFAAVANLSGCLFGCGVGPVKSEHSDGGSVGFDTVPVGSTMSLFVPVMDSANLDETILSASIAGTDADAFTVLSNFPITIPAGTQETITIQFSPTHTGSSSATLTLETEAMGPSPIPLEGTGTAAN